jgi:hypothetical protein
LLEFVRLERADYSPHAAALAGASLAALTEAAGLMLQRSTLIQLKQQRASPPICCAKNSLERSTDRTPLRLLGAIQFQSMLADIGKMEKTQEPADMHPGRRAGSQAE